ncbi:MAG: fibrobacter succinogenes major paralogous domain-containing protein [Bacteroidales bacterium]|jgi:uncharacterized protein (TIGR02145 family)|nr:fibrobacter succinogenes major paralogous domain-containing protein [Bacteroidales bacterium]
MKTHFFYKVIFATAFVLVFTACPKEPQKPFDDSCNSEIPGWGGSLGTVDFATTQEWTIKNDSIFQIWSDAVRASNCGIRDTFVAVSGEELNSNFNADCRSNPDQKGDLFSWCAVSRFADSLCPAPWRVPTEQDFINLDIAMGGTGTNRTAPIHNQFIIDNYLNPDVWGGAFGGRCSWDGTLERQGEWGRYWSSEIDGLWEAFLLGFVSGGNIAPKLKQSLGFGFTLRCVRDGEE